LQRDDWDRHWEEYNEGASDNPAQEYRREVIFYLLGLQGSGAGVRLLDIGSGQGDTAAYIRAKAPSTEILGLELSQSGVEISRKKVREAKFVQCNLLEPSRAPKEQRGWATHAICSEVIEHVDDPVLLLRNARDYMRPDCVLVLTAPGGPMSAFDKHIGHRSHFTPSAISDLLRQAGYNPEYAGKAGFPFFNVYRCIVILRGKKLIEDVSAKRNPSGSSLARLAMTIFHVLFRMNLRSSPWGWQMVARARFIPRTNLG
jgi:SAM-dependent methyltransferase